ncbi:hypothetical protein GCK32_001474 [Trichostrongylus colubriformis]|uniref:Uncharacterized protein n=1 Tax=Trichostrongylus colubriformis TaxID=6319 RepID=A0AAN8IYI1_TRICO
MDGPVAHTCSVTPTHKIYDAPNRGSLIVSSRLTTHVMASDAYQRVLLMVDATVNSARDLLNQLQANSRQKESSLASSKASEQADSIKSDSCHTASFVSSESKSAHTPSYSIRDLCSKPHQMKKCDDAKSIEIREGDDVGVTIVHADNVYINCESEPESIASSKRSLSLRVKSKDRSKRKTAAEKKPCDITLTEKPQPAEPCELPKESERTSSTTSTKTSSKRTPSEAPTLSKRTPVRTPTKGVSKRMPSRTPTKGSSRMTPSKASTKDLSKRTPTGMPAKVSSRRTPSRAGVKDLSKRTPTRTPTKGASKRTLSETPTKDSSKLTPSKAPAKDLSMRTPTRTPTKEFSKRTPSKSRTATSTLSGKSTSAKSKGKQSCIKETVERTVTTTAVENVPGKSPKKKRDVRKVREVHVYPESQVPELAKQVGNIITDTIRKTTTKVYEEKQPGKTGKAVCSARPVTASEQQRKGTQSSSSSSKKIPIRKGTFPLESAFAPLLASCQSLSMSGRRPLRQPRDPYRPTKKPCLTKPSSKVAANIDISDKSKALQGTPSKPVKVPIHKTKKPPGKLGKTKTPKKSRTPKRPQEPPKQLPPWGALSAETGVEVETRKSKAIAKPTSSSSQDSSMGRSIQRKSPPSSARKRKKKRKDSHPVPKRSESLLDLSPYAVAGRKLKQQSSSKTPSSQQQIRQSRVNIERSRQQMKQIDEEKRSSKSFEKNPAVPSYQHGIAKVRDDESSSSRQDSSKPTLSSVTGKLPSEKSTGEMTTPPSTSKRATPLRNKFDSSPALGKPVVRLVRKSHKKRNKKADEAEPGLKTARESPSYLEMANRYAVAGRKLRKPPNLENIRLSRESIKESREIMKKQDEHKRRSKEFAMNPANTHMVMLKPKEEEEILRMPPPPLSSTTTSSTSKHRRTSFSSSMDSRSLGKSYQRTDSSSSSKKSEPSDTPPTRKGGSYLDMQISRSNRKKKKEVI